MNELELFAGAGGGILAGMLLGHRTVCAVEYDAYARSILLARQNDGTFPPFPVWDDVRTFDGKPWRGIVDVVSGGFPCQDISAAGNGDGLDGERSGLWREMARIIREVRPSYVRVENSPMLTSRGLGTVLGDLAEMGFDAEWGVLSAADVGAQHLRERIWILAYANGMRKLQPPRSFCYVRTGASISGTNDPNTDSQHAQGVISERADTQGRQESDIRQARPLRLRYRGWPAEPGMGRMADGVANRSHRLKAIGNGQVPRVAAAAQSILGVNRC